MSFREDINKKPGVFIGVSAAIVVLAIIWLVYSMRGSKPAAMVLTTKAYFSDDDGKTFYADDVSNIPPYQHNGKKAYRAKVYEVKGSGQRFVGYLEGYDDKAKKQIEESIKKGLDPASAMQGVDLEVKKPGPGKWVKVGAMVSPEMTHVVTVTSPDGKKGEELQRVLPTQSEAKG
ncbi:MAG TPA: hypothetical protein VFW23_02775 [Tepidisphaeraceae bacterium]|nr:hypothetical protein [Tepidisphaeraceae bacterium]